HPARRPSRPPRGPLSRYRASGRRDPDLPDQPIHVARRYQSCLRHGAGVFRMIDTAFLQPEEQALTGRFINEGFVTAPADDRAGLDRIQRRAAELAADYLKLPHANDPLDFLDNVHSRVSVENLNGLRMHVIGGLNAESWLRATYFRLARSTPESHLAT